MTVRLRVACAVLAENGCLFAARRGPSRRNAGLWELPGGKLEHEESASDCLVRELKEELGLEVLALEEWAPVLYNEPGFQLQLIPIVCRRTGGTLILTEHMETGWFEPDRLMHLAWSPADVPILERWLRDQSKTP